MAAGALEAAEAEQIRNHLQTCEGCRRYYEEIVQVTALLSIEPEATIHTTEIFHKGVLDALRKQDQQSFWVNFLPWVQSTFANSRLTLPGAAAAALAVAALLIFSERSHRSFPSEKQTLTSSVRRVDPDLEPTLSHYQTVANQSLEQFDELLSAQAKKNPSAAPIFSASPLARISFLD